MSLNWQWNDKVGEVTDERGYTCNIYRGNAFMIAVNEYTKDGGDYYSLAWFFADERHAKNCLGLSKEYKENSPSDYNWTKFKLNTKYKETGKFIKMLADAKAKVNIELY